MNNREIWEQLNAAATEAYGREEAISLCRIAAEDILGIPYLSIITEPFAESAVDKGLLDRIVNDILSMRPVQYIAGKAAFCGLEFEVNESVLIPRPETEELVNLIVSQNSTPSPAILDIGTGSGCIAVSLAKSIQGAAVTALDISQKALATAAKNAERNGVSVGFAECDILSSAPAGTFDIIVSNPPYVTESEKKLMRGNVLEYEPHNALFVPDNDPLLFYRRIATLGSAMLNGGGRLYFEINERFGNETADMMRDFGYSEVTIENDIYERPRIVYGCLKR